MKKESIIKILTIFAVMLFAAQTLVATSNIPVTTYFSEVSKQQETILSTSAQPQKITSALKSEIKDIKPDEKIKVLIEAKDSESLTTASTSQKLSRTQITTKITQRKTKLNNIASHAKSTGADVLGIYPIGNIVSVEISKDMLDELTKSDDIKNIWPNKKVYPVLDKSVPQINAQDLWSEGLRGAGVTIAILDTGIDKTHLMLKGKVIKEEVFSGTSLTPCGSHGTHVAGIAAGTKAYGGSYDGVAPDAKIMSGKVLGETGECYGYWDQIIAGINWAVDPDGNPSTDDGADVISMSLGGAHSDPFGPASMAIKDAVDAGVPVVVASGNCGPCSPCEGYIGVSTPGVSPYAITVGAVNDYNEYACFSSGEYVEGVGIKPDVVAPGVAIMSSVPGNRYESWQGTSMATPHVAGAAALLIQANPQITPEQIKAIFEYTATDLGDEGKDIKFGSGLINLQGITDAKLLATPGTITDSIVISKMFETEITLLNYGTKSILISDITANEKIATDFTQAFSIQPMETKQVKVNINPAEIGLGTFNGNINILSNSTIPITTIPITLDIYQSEEPVIYSIQIPSVVFRKDIIQITVNATDNGEIKDITAYITAPTDDIFTQQLTKDTDSLWKASFAAEDMTGTYLVKIEITDNEGYKSTYDSEYEIVSLSLSIPEEVVIGKPSNFSVQYKNTKENDSEFYLIYAVTDWIDIIEEINTVGTRDIIAGGKGWFNWSWAPKKTGEYVMRLYIYENDTVLEFMEKNITSLVEDIADIKSLAITPDIVNKGNNIKITIITENKDTIPIDGMVEIDILDSNQKLTYVTILEAKSLAAQSETIFEHEMQALLPGGNYTLVSKLHYGNRIEEKSDVFRIITPQTGEISSIDVPPFEVETTKLLSVTFKNTGDVPLITEIKGIISDEEYTDYIHFGDSVINATASKVFESNWTAPGTAGTYNFNLTIDYEGNIIEDYMSVEVKDIFAPNITSVNFIAQIEQNNPFIVYTDISDHSAISSAKVVITDPDSKIFVKDSYIQNKTINAYSSETQTPGIYTFHFESCDIYSNCVVTEDYSFEVLPCEGLSILVISTDYGEENSTFSKALENNYCISKWNKAKIESPDISYLNRFDAVVWSAGSIYFNGLEEEDISLIETFTSAGGRLLLEGEDILFIYKEQAENITHASLLKDLVYTAAALDIDKESGNKTIQLTRRHPITKDISQLLSYNTAIQSYPDALKPIDAESIAEWSDEGSAFVIYNDIDNTGSMTAYIPFNINALEEEEKNKIILNTIEWLLTDLDNPNIKIESVETPDIIIEDRIFEYATTVSNTGTQPATTDITVLIDNNPVDSFSISLNVNEVKDVKRTITTGYGMHELTVTVNKDFLLKEQNYLDNTLKSDIFTISDKSDLSITDLAFEENPIAGEKIELTATVANLGGTKIENANVAFYVNDARISQIEDISLESFGNPGDEMNLTILWRAKEGEHTIKITGYPENLLEEFNESNNELTGTVYGSNLISVIVVYDDDGNMTATENINTTDIIVKILQENSYYVSVWKESEQGIPEADYLNGFDVVFWSSGNYWDAAIDSDDEEVIRNITTNIIFEGEDISFDHIDNENFSAETLGILHERDMILSVDNYFVNLNNAGAITTLSTLELDSSSGPYPDAVRPSGNSVSAAIWNNTNSSAIVAYEDNCTKRLFIAFTLDSINDQAKKEKFIIDAVNWAGPEITTYSLELKTGWNLISIPQQYLTDDVDTLLASIEGNYTSIWAWNASSDKAYKWITYLPDMPSWMNKLQKIDHTEGLWIYMENDDILTISGKEPKNKEITLQGIQEQTLNYGWNLVSYTSAEELAPSVALSSIKDKIEVVFGFDSTKPEGPQWKLYDPSAISDIVQTLKTMKQGEGYWIKVNTTEDVVFKYDGN